jgi:class 3 adenylate cyclase
VSTPTPQTIADWLEKLGLGQYAQRFAEKDIDASVLAHLTEENLKELGISLGHRVKLLAAIRELGGTLRAAEPNGTSTKPKLADTAERRQVTVMFSDLVGSTALSARMDPEDLREVIAAYQKCVAETVVRFGGFIAKYMGDGVLVYFGYPQAHEDDAERAVRASLELIAAVGALKAPVSLQTRVGIATGLVVVGDLIGSGEAQERGIVGETPNLAARIQAAAAPGSQVVSEATWRLARPAFEYEDFGPRELKGIPDTVRLWRVIGEGAVRGRFDARLIRGLAPLVGRSEEIALLRQRWAYASEGDGQLVLLSAPAGVGKSCLTQAFRESLDGVRPNSLQLFGSPFHTNSAFHPFISSLEWMSGIVRSDPPLRKLEKLEAVLRPALVGDADAAPLMAALLSIPFGERYPALEINEQVQKQRTMEVIEQQVVLLTGIGPALILVEDAHWMDATSLQL